MEAGRQLMVDDDADGTGEARRILVLAPMPIELAPVRRRLRLSKASGGAWRGRVMGTEVTAVLAGVGPSRSAKVARQAIDAHRPHHVVVCGVAGGIGSGISVGDLVVPEVVDDLDDGSSHRASPFGGTAPAGRVVTAGELVSDQAVLGGLAADAVDAIDMETAAIAAVCAERGVPWTAFRGISDHIADGLVDSATVGLMHPDGTPDLRAVARYVLRRPANALVLRRLARDTGRATKAATAALADAIEADAAGAFGARP